jgi:hypothetical protein
MLGKALGHAQAVILRKPMVSGFNPTLELGSAGYKVVTYCFVFFFFVLGVGWGGGLFGLSRASCHLCILYVFFLSLLEEGSWILVRWVIIKYKSLSSQSFF